MTDDERYAAGMTVRRAVLGDAHVDRATSGATDFTRGFQEFITRYAWGEIWTDERLDRRTRSLLTIAITAALGRTDELRLHVRASHNAGISRDEVRAVLQHVAVYAGVPAANTAFHQASAVFAELDDTAATR